MARSVAEIKKTMTDAFMADATIREKYGLSVNDTFSSKFSSVTIENILFFIVAACCHVLEVLLLFLSGFPDQLLTILEQDVRL